MAHQAIPGSDQDLDVLRRQCRHLLNLAEQITGNLYTAHKNATPETEHFLLSAHAAAQSIATLARYQLGVGMDCALNPGRPLSPADQQVR